MTSPLPSPVDTAAPDVDAAPDSARALVGAAVTKHTANVVAKAMGLSRPTLVGWLAGSCRQSTDDSVRARLPLLAGLDAKP